MRLFVGLELPWALRLRVAMLSGGGIGSEFARCSPTK